MGFVFGQQGAGFQAQGSDLNGTANQQQAAIGNAQANQGIAQQQQFVNALNAQNGLGNQSSVFNQLQGVANGQGPNPAQAMLANSTGANNAAQAALMAGQRGAGSNVGLIARQAAQQGSANQQNAIGQGAALQAQQSLGALGQLGGIAGQQVAQQQAGLQGLNAAAQGNQQNSLSALGGNNSANAGIAQQNAGLIPAVLGAAAKGGAAAFVAADGGQVPSSDHIAQYHSMMADVFSNKGECDRGMMSEGGEVPAILSPGEKYLPPAEAKAVASGKMNPMQAKTVPGKAPVKGDSPKNDIVPTKLEPGGVVIPRTKAQSKHSAEDFVSAVMARQGLKGRRS